MYRPIKLINLLKKKKERKKIKKKKVKQDINKTLKEKRIEKEKVVKRGERWWKKNEIKYKVRQEIRRRK